MIRFGGPVFCKDDSKRCDPEWLVNEHKKKGYKAAYAPPVDLSQTDEIKKIRRAFEEADIMIAEVGYWENLMDLDLETRAANRKKMTEALALAEELGANCAVDIFGSYVTGKGDAKQCGRNFSNEAFEDAVYMARFFIDEVKPKTAYFTYEVFPFSVVDSVDSIERLIRAVDREKFGVHLDLSNMINCPRLYWENAELARECVKRFGNRIVSSHVKDLKMIEPAITVIFNEVMPGEGVIDFGAYARALNFLPHDVPFMIEHLKTEEEYDRAAAHIRAEVKKAGIDI